MTKKWSDEQRAKFRKTMKRVYAEKRAAKTKIVKGSIPLHLVPDKPTRARATTAPAPAPELSFTMRAQLAFEVVRLVHTILIGR